MRSQHPIIPRSDKYVYPRRMPPKGSASAAVIAVPKPGTILMKRWKLGPLLGEGACGQVYEATDVQGRETQFPWVIKVTPLPPGQLTV
jgi:hypothetical protein